MIEIDDDGRATADRFHRRSMCILRGDLAKMLREIHRSSVAGIQIGRKNDGYLVQSQWKGQGSIIFFWKRELLLISK